MQIGKHTWATDTYDALVELGGRAALHQIYDKVHEIRTNRNDTWPPKAKEIIRKEIKFKARESSSFLGREDLYYPVFGIGRGIWALKRNNPEKGCFTCEEKKNISFKERCRIEGELKERKVLSYSRNKVNVLDCKKRDNYTCQACSFFCEGKIVEAHHLEPLSMSKRKNVQVEDLITLCPTCHRLAHFLIDSHFEDYAHPKKLIQAIKFIS